MVTYRATLDVPSDLVSRLENLIAAQRDDAGGTWRALTSWDQAIVFLVHLAKGEPYAQLGRHFGISEDTARRYVNEAIAAVAPLAPSLTQAVDAGGELRRLLLDGTLIPTWRCIGLAAEANDDPLYNAKHREHGMNAQALTDTSGDLVFLGEARPGSTADITAARADGIIDAVTAADIETTADSGYQGAGGTIRTPIKRPKGKGHNGWEKQANTALARLRAPVERAFAELKRWGVLTKVRISPNRVTALLHAIFVIQKKRASLTKV